MALSWPTQATGYPLPRDQNNIPAIGGLYTGNNTLLPVSVDANGNINVNADLTVGNISIGSVSVNPATTITQMAQVLVTNTATLVGNSTLNTGGKFIEVGNLGNQTVYTGNATVTTSTGQPLFANQSKSIPYIGDLYGVVASGNCTVAITGYK